jgi:hypothetical protein
MPDELKLILKRSGLATAGFEDYDVLSDGKLVGRIFKASAAASARPWFWLRLSSSQPQPGAWIRADARSCDGSVPQELVMKKAGAAQ